MSESSDTELGNTRPRARIDEIDFLLENMSKSLQSLHQDLKAKVEPKLLLAKIRREKLRTHVAVSKIQYMYSEIETFLTTKELENDLLTFVDESKQLFHKDLQEKNTNAKKRTHEESESDLHETTAEPGAARHLTAKRPRSLSIISSSSNSSKSEEVLHDTLTIPDLDGPNTSSCTCKQNKRRDSISSSRSNKKSTGSKPDESVLKPVKDTTKENTSSGHRSHSEKVKEKSSKNKHDSDRKKNKSDENKEKSSKTKKSNENETKLNKTSEHNAGKSKDTSHKRKDSMKETKKTSDEVKSKTDTQNKLDETKKSSTRSTKTYEKSKEKKEILTKQNEDSTEKSEDAKCSSPSRKTQKSGKNTLSHGSNNLDKQESRSTNTNKSSTSNIVTNPPAPKSKNINGTQHIDSSKTENLLVEKANLKKTKDNGQLSDAIETKEGEKTVPNDLGAVDNSKEAATNVLIAMTPESPKEIMEICVKTELDIDPYLEQVNNIASRLQFENNGIIPRNEPVADASTNANYSNIPNNIRTDDNNNSNKRNVLPPVLERLLRNTNPYQDKLTSNIDRENNAPTNHSDSKNIGNEIKDTSNKNGFDFNIANFQSDSPRSPDIIDQGYFAFPQRITDRKCDTNNSQSCISRNDIEIHNTENLKNVNDAASHRNDDHQSDRLRDWERSRHAYSNNKFRPRSDRSVGSSHRYDTPSSSDRRHPPRELRITSHNNKLRHSHGERRPADSGHDSSRRRHHRSSTNSSKYPRNVDIHDEIHEKEVNSVFKEVISKKRSKTETDDQSISSAITLSLPKVYL